MQIAQDPLGRPGKRVARKEHIDFFSRPVLPLYRGRTSHAAVILNRWQDAGTPVNLLLLLMIIMISKA